MDNEKMNQNPIEETVETAAPAEAAPSEAVEAATEAELPVETKIKTKKSLKGIIIGGISAACVAAVAAVVLFFPYVANFAIKTFSSGAQYQQHVVSKSAENIAEDIADIIAIIKSDEEKAQSTEAKISLKVGEDFRKQIADNMDTDIDFAFINDLSFKATSVVKNKQFSSSISLLLKDSSLVSIDAIKDSETGKSYLKFPDLSDKYMVFEDLVGSSSASGSVASAVGNDMSKFIDAIPDEDVIKALITEYVDTVLENIEDVEKESDKIEINGVSQSLTVLKSTIDEKDVESIAKAVLKKAKSDENLEKIIKDLVKATDEEADEKEAWESFQESIEDALEDIDSFSDENDISIKLEIYVNGKGDIRGIKVKSEDDSLTYRSVQSGSKAAIEISAKDGDQELKISGSGKTSFGKVSGEFDVKNNGEKIMKITLKDGVAKKDKTSGKFEIKLTEEGAELFDLEDVDGLPKIADCKLVLDLKSDKETSSLDVSIKEGSNVILGVALESKITEGGDIAIPADAIDITGDSYEYLKTVDLNAFINKIKATALPADVTSAVEEYLRNNIDTREYWGAIEEYTAIMYGGSYRDVAKIAPAEFFNQISGGMSMDAFTAQFIQTYETTVVPMMKSQFGDDYKVTAEYDRSYRLSNYDLDDLKDNINYNYNIAKDRITEGYSVDFVLNAKGSVSEDTHNVSAYLVKIDGKWYLCDYSGDFGSF